MKKFPIGRRFLNCDDNINCDDNTRSNIVNGLRVRKDIIMNKIAFMTLGCKVNQADTASMQELFRQAGYIVAILRKRPMCMW